MAKSSDTQRWDEFIKGLWRENPIFVGVLGLCPSMAVTNTTMNGLVMGLASTFVLVGSSALVSMVRNYVPKQVRISVFIIIIATFVTAVDFSLAAVMPAAHKQLGAFIALIVVNCIILGRQEAFASKNTVALSIIDALGMSAGFTLALVMIGGIREVLGMGSLLGISVLGMAFEPWAIMILPPGGFLTLGALLSLFTWLKSRNEKKRQTTVGAV
ncbi:MAG: electron transport complex subunit RsxE [Deltaproteobacteria bacterium CG2_30_63_29]|nr:MAG: electron transport complex subunit RsxE [Deltaproteobacteria bacterium CG2_30_63_29]PJB39363.1 MAG: electron transport complex subunit RsxE [Deltaproteobacteria bacterium CG_4_9_14_3_um_filter_63_12]